MPVGPDDRFFADMAAALDLASQSHLPVCFSLFDFLWLQTRDAKSQTGDATATFPHRYALRSAGGREALLQHVLIPLFREFRGHTALFAWEIVNEPEWAIPEFQRSQQATLSFADARVFFAEIAQAVHEESGGVRATLGSARLQWLRAWSEIGLDILQAHCDPQLEKNQDRSLAGQLARLTRLAQPTWLGELPARDPSVPDYSLEAALTACRDAGLAGAAIWRWRPPEPADVAFGSVEPRTLSAWLFQTSEFRV